MYIELARKAKGMKAAERKRRAVCLVSDERLAGRYVAMRSVARREVIASGHSPLRVLAAARRKGVASPLVFYVPKEDLACLY